MVDYLPLDDVFTALGDPTRRAILTRLRRSSATVGEVAQPFDVSLNAISKHVKVLERAGLVTRAKVGREHHLSLNAVPLQRATRWLVDYEHFWENSLDRMERLLQRRRPT